MKSSLTAFGTYGFMCSMLAAQVAIASSSGLSKNSGIKGSSAKRAPVSHHTAKRAKR